MNENQVTRLQDVIVPELFNAAKIKRTAELSALIQSGIVTQNEELNRLASGSGYTVNMPFFNDLTGDSQVMNDSDEIKTGKIGMEKDIAVRLIRAKGWAAHELAGALAGASPFQSILELVSAWESRDEQRILIQLLNGIFDSVSMAPLWHDTNDAISNDVILSAKQLLGDAADRLTAIAMHSATYTSLQKKGAIDMVPNTAQNIGPRDPIAFPTYLGYRVIKDDMLPAGQANGNMKYTSYLFASGVIGRGDGTPVDLTISEVARDAGKSTDKLYVRSAKILHPFGIKWRGTPTQGEPTPSNATLATGTNWERVYETKQIGIVKVTHTI
jgi:hypothetical protein